MVSKVQSQLLDFLLSALPSASKQKLHELAKDELLASLNVPPPPPYDSSPVDNDASDLDESFNDVLQAQQKEKERKEMKRQRVMEEILETEKNYISCLETLDSVSCILDECGKHFLISPEIKLF